MAGIRLERGEKIPLTNGETITIVGELGTGGQGIVYRVRMDNTGQEKALKWYFPSKLKNAQEFYDRLREKNIPKGAPSDAFVWPEALTKFYKGTFGYIMKIYPRDYVGFPYYLLGTKRFESENALINAALNIVTAFHHLHEKGWNYQDLNDGNFAIEPHNGNVLICDNDNVVGHGEYSGILGKERYMAPEIVRGESNPNKQTDRYSLAVILFMLFTHNHPLEGEKTVVSAFRDKHRKLFFGTEPVFVHDPKDASNRPRSDLHKGAIEIWKYFPDFLKEAFFKSFSKESLHKAEGRLLEKQWIHVFMRLKSSIIECPYCHDTIYAESSTSTVCPNCKKNISISAHLKFPNRTDTEINLPLWKGVKLYSYHIKDQLDSEGYEREAAEVMISKTGQIGLKNKTNDIWKISAPNGQRAAKGPNEIVVLGLGFKIDFGHNIIAEVVENNK